MEKLLTAGEVCRHFRINPSTLWRWRRAGKVVALLTPGGMPRFRESDVDKVLEEESVSV